MVFVLSLVMLSLGIDTTLEIGVDTLFVLSLVMLSLGVDTLFVPSLVPDGIVDGAVFGLSGMCDGFGVVFGLSGRVSTGGVLGVSSYVDDTEGSSIFIGLYSLGL